MVVYVSSSRLKLVVGTALFLTFALTVALVVSGYVFPYSGGEPPRPKRLYLQVSLVQVYVYYIKPQIMSMVYVTKLPRYW